MPIMREYECGDCGTRFEKLHMHADEPAPECPGCQALAARNVPSAFTIGGSTKSQAIDMTYKMIEQDHGMTNLKDNLREGDTAAPSLSPHLQKAVDNYWKPSGDVMQAAKQGAKLSASEGSNPLMIAQRMAKDRGPGPAVRCSPVASVR